MRILEPVKWVIDMRSMADRSSAGAELTEKL